MTIDRRNALRLTSLAAAGVGITTGLGGAARADGLARQLTLKGKRTAADLPEVLVPGTPYFVHYELRDADGNLAGTESAQCTPVTVGLDGALIVASLVLLLGNGMITASTAFRRPLPSLTEVVINPRQWSHLFAVTGGTGDYDGATGSITIDHLSQEDDVLTVTLD
ncbi:hypothetical protein ACFP3U_14830 [Kitasatospora misakiensis]|uniref:Twin-arginine translocation signal domain-containing protein n=1 Tax=Kitasatospora misakiensis TaxID=67330 RepID=A0ABW0X6X4_9ACTN